MEAPKEYYERMGPRVEAHMAKDPEMSKLSESDRKSKAKEFLDVSWGRFSPEKRAEFQPKAPKVDNDKMFSAIFGDGKPSPAPATGDGFDLDDLFDNFMEGL